MTRAITSIIAPAEVIRDLLCGEQQHDEHCRGWRWHLYMRDTARRMDAVNEATKRIIADRRALTSQRQADLMLRQWQSLRSLPPAERIKAMAEVVG